MISLIYKSKLLREEIKHWLAIVALSLWGLIATIFAFSRSNRMVVIGMDEAGTRIISSTSDRLVQNELKAYLKSFFDLYYSYSDVTYNERMKLATDMFSEDLWQREKEKIAKIGDNLKKMPLEQKMVIESIDRVDNDKLEAILALSIRTRMNEQKVKLRVVINYKRTERSEMNPWGFEITDISDATL